MGSSTLRVRAARVVGALGLAVGAYALGSLLGVAAVVTLESAGVEVGIRGRVLLSVLMLQVVAFGAVSFLYLRSRGLTLRRWVGVRLPDLEEWMYVGAGYVVALLAAIAAVVLLFAVVALFDLELPRTRVADLGEEDPTVFLVMAVLSVLVVGPAEELLFRGVIQRSLREAFGAAAAIGIATAVFAAIHLPNYTGPWVSRFAAVALLVLPALVFGALYEYTGNVVVPAIVHGLYNATLMSFGYLSIRYGDAAAVLIRYGDAGVLLSGCVV